MDSDFHLSHSRVSCYLICPKQFEYRYVRRVPEPVTEALVVGLAVHSALARYCAEKVKDSSTSKSLAIATLSAEWREKPYLISNNWNGEIVWESDEQSALHAATELLEHYLDEVDLQPVFPEQEFQRGGKIPFVGRIDLIDQRGYIIDFKTKSAKWSSPDYRKREFSKDFQPIAYSYLLGGPATVEFHFLIKAKTPRVAIERRTVHQDELDWFANVLLRSVSEGILKGIFPPAGNPWSRAWPCGWCPFAKICRTSYNTKGGPGG